MHVSRLVALIFGFPQKTTCPPQNPHLFVKKHCWHGVRVVKELVLKANRLCLREFESRPCRFFSKTKRQRRDSNSRGRSPADFESASLTTRTRCHDQRRGRNVRKHHKTILPEVQKFPSQTAKNFSRKVPSASRLQRRQKNSP